MHEQREFIVQVVVTTSHEFIVTARSEEDAISQAESMYLEDHERGKILSEDIDSSDAYPFREDMDDEDEDDE